jgi:hypothetical protein
MNTVRAAPVTKSGNPLSDEPLVELTLPAMPPATEKIVQCGDSNHKIEVAG